MCYDKLIKGLNTYDKGCNSQSARSEKLQLLPIDTADKYETENKLSNNIITNIPITLQKIENITGN